MARLFKEKEIEIDPEEYERQTYNVNGTNSRNKGLYSHPGKYKNTLKANDKQSHYFAKPITISVLVGTGIGMIVGLATGFGAPMAMIFIGASLIIGIIINAIMKSRR